MRLEINEVGQTQKVKYLMYGGLNKNSSYRPIGRGVTRRCGFVGVGLAFLEEVYH